MVLEEKCEFVGLYLIVRHYNKLWTSFRTGPCIMDDAMDLFGANLMFVLDQFTFVLAKGWLAFYIKRERIDQMGLGALPQPIQPLEKLP